MGPCAKQRVVAVVSHNSPNHDQESVIVGENICLTPHTKCPRVAGEAYAKCYTECSQLGHAEEVALRVVRSQGIPIANITAIDVYGHTGPCDNCRAVLHDLGLLALTKFHPNVAPPKLTQGSKSNISEAYNLERPSSHSRAAKAS